MMIIERSIMDRHIATKRQSRAEPQLAAGSDDDPQHDTASITSSASENKSVLDEGQLKRSICCLLMSVLKIFCCQVVKLTRGAKWRFFKISLKNS